MAKPAPKIKKAHDYLSIDLGNGRVLTVNRRGTRATGGVPEKVYDYFDRAMQGPGNYGDKIDAFAADIDKIWPEWHVAPTKPKVGDRITYDFGKRMGGPDTGEVVRVARTRATVRWARLGLISLTFDDIARGGNITTADPETKIISAAERAK